MHADSQPQHFHQEIPSPIITIIIVTIISGIIISIISVMVSGLTRSLTVICFTRSLTVNCFTRSLTVICFIGSLPTSASLVCPNASRSAHLRIRSSAFQTGMLTSVIAPQAPEAFLQHPFFAFSAEAHAMLHQTLQSFFRSHSLHGGRIE